MMIRDCKRLIGLQHGTNAFKVCESEMMLFVESYAD